MTPDYEKRVVEISEPLEEIILQPDRRAAGLAYQVIVLHEDGTWEIEVR